MSSSLTSVVKTIEVDPRVPGIRDEIPQARQCSPELGSPNCQLKSPFSQELQRYSGNLSPHKTHNDVWRTVYGVRRFRSPFYQYFDALKSI